MDLKLFDQNYNKIIADALKIGSLDSRTDSILKDVVRTLQSEIVKKKDVVQRTIGEIRQLEQTHAIILGVVQNHTKNEERNQENQKEHEELTSNTDEEPVKKIKKEATKKQTKKVKKSSTSGNKFVGDKSQ